MTDGRLAGRRIVVGVTGGIAAHKTAQVVTGLRKHGADVFVAMTPSAAQFVAPLTFRALSAHPVATGMWDPDGAYDEPHITLGEQADLYIIAPATAHTIAKLALGLSDDVVSATALVTRAPIVLAPAMSDTMYEHPATQAHLQTLRERGVRTIGPDVGRLASGKEAIGRMVEPEAIVEEICRILEGGKTGTPTPAARARGGARRKGGN